MSKKIIIIILIIFLLLSITIILLNETLSNNIKSRFFGEWYGTHYDTQNNITFEMYFIFYKNNTAKNEYYFENEINERELLYTLWRTFEIEDDELCLTYLTNTSFTRCYKYSFSNENKNLTISSLIGDEEYYFTKNS